MKTPESQPTFMEKIENKIENMKYEIGEELDLGRKVHKENKK